MTPDVPAICAGLTKAQRRVVQSMAPGHWHSRYDSTANKQPGSVMRHLAVRLLTERDRADNNGAPYHRLTPLGLAVRAHLLREQGDRIDGEGGRDG